MGMKQEDILLKARTIKKITTIMVIKKTTKMMTLTTMKMMMLTMITRRMMTRRIMTRRMMTMITSEQLKPEGERTHVDTPQQQRAAVNIIDFQLCCPSTNFA